MNKINQLPPQVAKSAVIKVNAGSLDKSSAVSQNKEKFIKDKRIASSQLDKKNIELPKANKLEACSKNDSAASRAAIKLLMSLQQTMPDSNSALQQVDKINQNLIKLEEALSNKGR